MAVFTTVYVKLGNIWPVHYLAALPTGETARFCLVRRVKRKGVKCCKPADLLFVKDDADDRKVYAGELFWGAGTADECCTIDYDGIPILLEASRCKLAYSELPWKERFRIINKLLDNITTI